LSMYIDQRKEQFSYAYVHAVASAAGFSIGNVNVDDDSVDMKISANRKFHVSAPELNVQLKCKSGVDRSKSSFPYPLKIKNYEDLRGTDVIVPRILVVVCVPDDVTTWLDQQPDHLTMYHCGYWHSLRNEGASTNVETVTVHIDTGKAFTVPELTRLMSDIGRRVYP